MTLTTDEGKQGAVPAAVVGALALDGAAASTISGHKLRISSDFPLTVTQQ
jgi:hypothetical protein